MEKDYMSILIEMINLIQNPDIEKCTKEKAIKFLIKQSVDIIPNYGCKTKQDLKDLIDLPLGEKNLFEAICTYLSANNTNN